MVAIIIVHSRGLRRFANPRERQSSLTGTALQRTRTLPTSAGRRAQPQCNGVFKLEKLPTGQYITVPRQAELRLRMPQNEGQGKMDSMRAQMNLTADIHTARATGRTEAKISYERPQVEPWMRGNTKRFGNNGPWVSNRAASVGAAPSVNVDQAAPYLAGTKSISNATYRTPYGSAKGDRDVAALNVASTLRLEPGAKFAMVPDSAPISEHDLTALMQTEEAFELTNQWMVGASAFENEIVKKLVRDVTAKMYKGGAPPGLRGDGSIPQAW